MKNLIERYLTIVSSLSFSEQGVLWTNNSIFREFLNSVFFSFLKILNYQLNFKINIKCCSSLFQKSVSLNVFKLYLIFSRFLIEFFDFSVVAHLATFSICTRAKILWAKQSDLGMIFFDLHFQLMATCG